MSILEMSKLKALLQEIAIKLGTSGSVSSTAVIEALRKAHPDAIRAVSRELENGMMQRVLSQLAKRRPKDLDGGPDLFSDYPGVQQLFGIEVERDGKRTTEYKSISTVTLQELGAWLAADRKTSGTRRQRNPGITRMFRDCSKAAKGAMGMTVGKAMAIRRASGP